LETIYLAVLFLQIKIASEFILMFNILSLLDTWLYN